jgi:molecular chaperone HscB
VFGLPRRFGIDRAALERRFYELSRETHPDRFAASGADGIRQAMERMSLLNEAYTTLKSQEELRPYFLKLEGYEAPAGAKQQIPAELAESWFELQDAAMENPEAAADLFDDFERALRDLRAQGHAELKEVEHEIDATVGDHSRVPRELLDRLSQGIRSMSYLSSMERDVERLKGRR